MGKVSEGNGGAGGMNEQKIAAALQGIFCCLPGYFLSDMPWESGGGTGQGRT